MQFFLTWNSHILNNLPSSLGRYIVLSMKVWNHFRPLRRDGLSRSTRRR